jgi:DNA helicase-2/ATP-dependent DNA helicase PcrA
MPTADELLAELDPEQRVAAEAVDGPVCILAGAGTGKTRTITHRIAYGALTGALPADHVLAVTFTVRAAGELGARLRRLGVPRVAARTFHSAALRQLRYFWPRVVGGGFPELVESKLRLVAAAATRCGLGSGVELKDLATEIEWAKATLVEPVGYPAAAAAAGRIPPVAADRLAEIYRAYEAVRMERNLLDFDEVLLLTAAALEEHPDVAEEVRARYRYFVVDEFQDVTPLQARLLRGWLGGRHDVCVVGDPDQTIYSFAGASAGHLLDFPAEHPGTTVVRLVRDYRSTPQVVGAARTVLGEPAGPAKLVAQRPAGPAPAVRGFADEPAEAAAVAARCAELIDAGTSPAEIAILFRINAASAGYEQALADRGIGYQLRGAERFFDRPEVRTAVQLLRGAVRSADGDAPGPLVERVADALGSVWRPDPPPGPGAARDRWESVRALVDLARDAAARDPAADLGGFVAELAERAAAAHPPRLEQVTLASLHAAKGLEWDAVFVVGLAEGVLPIVYATTDAQIAEERRLLYVGVTRARRHLWLSWSAARTSGARRGREPSRFLGGLLPSGPAAGGRPAGRRRDRSVGQATSCRGCGRPVRTTAERMLGRCATCPGPGDPVLLGRLVAWRLGAARDAGQPAYCVFDNATLVAIAESRPGSRAQLAAIPGVGTAKLARFGAAVLDLVGAGGDPPGGELPAGGPAAAGAPPRAPDERPMSAR